MEQQKKWNMLRTMFRVVVEIKILNNKTTIKPYYIDKHKR